MVEYFGGLPDLFARNLKRFPPTLILHGDADRVVPVAETYQLEEPDGDAYKQSLAFFDKHVKRVPDS